MARLTRSHADPFSTAMRAMATAMRSHETAGGAAGVIAARTGMATAALGAPNAANDAEMSRMVSEKTTAFAASGAAAAAGSSRMAETSARFAMEEAVNAARAFTSMAACRSPQDLFALQARLTMDLFSRGMAHGNGMASQASHMGEAALAPVHKTVTANARRLKSR